jgi:hypothetical protein
MTLTGKADIRPSMAKGGYVPKGAIKHLWETPCADPHAGCCGGWGLETLGYPIRFYLTTHHLLNLLTRSIPSFELRKFASAAGSPFFLCPVMRASI